MIKWLNKEMEKSRVVTSISIVVWLEKYSVYLTDFVGNEKNLLPTGPRLGSDTQFSGCS